MLLAAPSSFAQDNALPQGEDGPAIVEDTPPPYEPQLLRLTELMGSLHFLRQLCGGIDAPEWRSRMEDFLASENPSPLRRARFITQFNRGYQAFDTTYTSCTRAAEEATRLFVAEGKKLSEGIVNRYGN